MRPHPNTVRLLYCLAAIALGLAGMFVPFIKRFCAYGASILVMIYICSLGGAAIGIFTDSRNYIAAAIGFVGGAVLGIAAGIPLGRTALAQIWLYWLLILIVAFVITRSKPLVGW